jgi:histidyl-tRNA synthetase
MNDLLPADAPRWERFADTVRAWLRSYGYSYIRMPILERTELFVRSIGEVTDIVEKEMYSFVDRLNGESLTLRPEGTAGCVRAVLEHNLLYGQPQRLWYDGPMFRHERPQQGRYRQFHQVGVEALGYAGPDIDVEHILMCARLWRLLGLDGVRLEINTLGDAGARARHRARLVAYLETHAAELDDDARRRLHGNPLRVLDTKNPALQALVEAAPKLIDELDDESASHFAAVRAALDRAGIAYRVNPRLVRGLDYYNRTVVEWVTDRLGAQGTICAGGRYDGLVEQIGGRPTPACGYAIGVERVLALMQAHEPEVGRAPPDVYLAHGGEQGTDAMLVAERLREAGLDVVVHCGGGGFRSQMRRADASGARWAVLIGESEAAAGKLALKPLRVAGEQRLLDLDEALAAIQRDGRH